MAKALDNLKKDRDFLKVIDGLFLKQGKEALWENIRHFEELNLQSFDERRAKTIESLKRKVGSRLDLEEFFDLIESDGETALDETENTIKEEA